MFAYMHRHLFGAVNGLSPHCSWTSSDVRQCKLCWLLCLGQLIALCHLQMLQQHALPFGLLDLVLTPIVKVCPASARFSTATYHALALKFICCGAEAGASLIAWPCLAGFSGLC